jgi:hypothetical protein
MELNTVSLSELEAIEGGLNLNAAFSRGAEGFGFGGLVGAGFGGVGGAIGGALGAIGGFLAGLFS